jgi:hopanoid biosynthesis associated protein HpnK
MKQVILNADDFGRTASINAVVMRAHREGVLTSASLMVTGAAAAEAAALARQEPALAVGLHLVLVGGQAALPPADIPHLVDSSGRFPDDPATAGLRYAFSAAARRELAQELEAQFERFAATRLPLSHVDSHMHLHMHPVLLPLVLSLVEQYGACGLRVPRDNLRLGLRYSQRMLATKTGWALVFALLARSALRHLRQHPIRVVDRVYGLFQTGRMEEAYVLKVLRQLDVPSAELYFHPDSAAQSEPLGPNPGDLATLLSPAVRQVIEEQGLRLATYCSL